MENGYLDVSLKCHFFFFCFKDSSTFFQEGGSTREEMRKEAYFLFPKLEEVLMGHQYPAPSVECL